MPHHTRGDHAPASLKCAASGLVPTQYCCIQSAEDRQEKINWERATESGVRDGTAPEGYSCQYLIIILVPMN